MNRRTYLTGSAGVATTLLAGCTFISGSSNSGNSSNGDGTSTATATATATPEPSPVKGITFEGTEMQVQLRQDSDVGRLDFLNPAGENIESKQVGSATQVSFPLVSPANADSINSIYESGDYTVVAVPKAAQGTATQQTAQSYRISVPLSPDVSIAGIKAATAMPSKPKSTTSTSAIWGALAIKLKNSGRLPVWVTQTRIFGKNLPTARTDQNIGDDRRGPEGAALDWYDRDVTALRNSSEGRIPLPIGNQWYLTVYLPIAISESQYNNLYSTSAIRKRIESDYSGKTVNGVFSAGFSNGQHVAAPFRVLFAGELRRFLRMGSDNIFAFGDTRVAFDPAISRSGKNATGNLTGSFDGNVSSISFPKNATEGLDVTTIAPVESSSGNESTDATDTRTDSAN